VLNFARPNLRSKIVAGVYLALLGKIGMINLLPEQEKKALAMEGEWRKILICLIFVTIFLVFFSSILFFIKSYVSGQERVVEEVLSEKEKEFKGSGFQNFKKIIEEANQNLSKIKKLFQEQILIASFFEKISTLTPTEISFTNVSFQKVIKEISEKSENGEKKQMIFAEVHIIGKAQEREHLFLFKKNLETDKSFKEAKFALSSWMLPTDITFFLDLVYEP